MIVKSSVFFCIGAVLLGVYQIFFGNNCHSRLENPIPHLATKSPYVIQPGFLYNFTTSEKTVGHFIPEECSAEKIWMVSRHGTRNPGRDMILRMLKEVSVLQKEIVAAHQSDIALGQLCEEELAAIETWQPDLDLDPEKQKWLVRQGELELFGIGSRFRNTFPQLFVSKYSPDTFKFKYTKTQRAEASAQHFARGVFGHAEASKVNYPEALDADPILRFYKACPRWKKEVDKNPATYQEQKKFESTPAFKKMMKKLQTRLGLTRALTLSELSLVYQTCSFETAWTPNRASPWCGLFDEADFQMLEYRQDLEYYWVDGYGHELTYKQACAPVNDILDQFREKIEYPNSSHKVTAYFTHSGTLLKFLSHLGLFNDSEPLRSNSYHLHKHNRKWRTSFIDKFATNLAFVLFRCETETSKVYQVGVLFQEHPINIPFCGGDWICPFEQFRSYFEKTVKSCSEDVASMCQL